MSVESLRADIKQQRSVRTLGYMGFGVEVPCDELEALIELAEKARRFADFQGQGINPVLEPDEPGSYEIEADLLKAVGKVFYAAGSDV